jgi:hypothetical protein
MATLTHRWFSGGANAPIHSPPKIVIYPKFAVRGRSDRALHVTVVTAVTLMTVMTVVTQLMTANDSDDRGDNGDSGDAGVVILISCHVSNYVFSLPVFQTEKTFNFLSVISYSRCLLCLSFRDFRMFCCHC